MIIFKPKYAKINYEKDMLPKNRRELFFDVLKLQWSKLLLLGVLMYLCYLPMYYSHLLMIIPAIALAGLLRIIRQYAWEENVFFIHDFGQGIKQNAKQSVLLVICFYILYTLTLLFFNMSATISSIAKYLFLFPMAMFLIFLPVFGYMLAVIPIYNNSFFKNMKICVFVYVKTPLKSLFAMTCVLLPFLPSMSTNVYWNLGGTTIAALLSPCLLLGLKLFCYNQLDKFINQTHFPELVGKGVYKKND